MANAREHNEKITILANGEGVLVKLEELTWARAKQLKLAEYAGREPPAAPAKRTRRSSTQVEADKQAQRDKAEEDEEMRRAMLDTCTENA